MNEFDIKVRVIAEVFYLTPPESVHEKIIRRMAEHQVQAMASTLENQVRQLVVDQINAERDLSEAEIEYYSKTVETNSAERSR